MEFKTEDEFFKSGISGSASYCETCNIWYMGYQIHKLKYHQKPKPLPKPKRELVHYECKACEYETRNKNQYNRHLQTKKHLKNGIAAPSHPIYTTPSSKN